MSIILDHARTELELVGVDDITKTGILKVVEAFAEVTDSGAQASWVQAMICDLFNLQPLAPVTNNPDEWCQHDDDVWQNRRQGEAFSSDGGKTYYLLSERERDGKITYHTAREYIKAL